MKKSFLSAAGINFQIALSCLIPLLLHLHTPLAAQKNIAPAKFYQEGLKTFNAKQYDLAKNYWLQAAGNGGLSLSKYKTIITNLLSIRDYSTAASIAKFNIKDFGTKEQGFAYNSIANKLLDADTSQGLAIEPINLYNNYLSSGKKANDKNKKTLLSNYQYQLAYYNKKGKKDSNIADVSNKISSIYPNTKELTWLPKKYANTSINSTITTPIKLDTAALEASLKSSAEQRAASALAKGNAAYEAKDYPTAKLNWEIAEKLGSRNASLQLGKLYEFGAGGNQDYAKAKDQYQTAAGKECPAAYSSMGNLYENGLGVPKDPALAKEWYKKGKDAGDSISIEKLNKSLSKTAAPSIQNNKTTLSNTSNTDDAASTAPATGPVTAQKGQIVGKIITAIPANADAACNKGFDEYKLGNMAGAKENWEKAAAAKGNSPAKFKSMNELGNLYFHGQGVEKDYVKSLEWFQKATNNGLPSGNNDAAKFVGTQYENGFGTNQSYPTALLWYKKAKKMGNKYVDGDISRAAEKVKKGK